MHPDRHDDDFGIRTINVFTTQVNDNKKTRSAIVWDLQKRAGFIKSEDSSQELKHNAPKMIPFSVFPLAKQCQQMLMRTRFQ